MYLTVRMPPDTHVARSRSIRLVDLDTDPDPRSPSAVSASELCKTADAVVAMLQPTTSVRLGRAMYGTHSVVIDVPSSIVAAFAILHRTAQSAVSTGPVEMKPKSLMGEFQKALDYLGPNKESDIEEILQWHKEIEFESARLSPLVSSRSVHLKSDYCDSPDLLTSCCAGHRTDKDIIDSATELHKRAKNKRFDLGLNGAPQFPDGSKYPHLALRHTAKPYAMVPAIASQCQMYASANDIEAICRLVPDLLQSMSVLKSWLDTLAPPALKICAKKR